jgi:hypothetical protein
MTNMMDHYHDKAARQFAAWESDQRARYHHDLTAAERASFDSIMRARGLPGGWATPAPRPAAAAAPPRAAPTPRETAYAEGQAEARADAVVIVKLCCGYGRADLAHTLVGRGLSNAEAKRALISAMWDTAFSRARGRA